jgi:hypothetical protein
LHIDGEVFQILVIFETAEWTEAAIFSNESDQMTTLFPEQGQVNGDCLAEEREVVVLGGLAVMDEEFFETA